MFTFLLVLQAIIATALVAVILMQRSEGGGLGMGGSPSGLMSARGAADFLTRATTILATIFVVMSIGLAAYAGVQRAQRPIDTSLARPAGAAGGLTPPPATDSVPLGGDPLAGAAAGVAGAAGNASGAVLPSTAAPTIERPAPATPRETAVRPTPSAERIPARDAAPRTPTQATRASAPAATPARSAPASESNTSAPATTTRSTAPVSNPTAPTTPAPATSNGSGAVPLAQ